MIRKEVWLEEAKKLYLEKDYTCSKLVEHFKGKLTYAEIKKIIKENCE